MSDGAAPAPAAPSPAPVEDVAEASDGTKPPAEGETTATPKPRTEDDDLEDLLKKSGGLKYKAKGKEKSVATVADLRRLLSSRDEIDSVAADALKKTQDADGLKTRLAGIAKLPPREQASALKDIGIDPGELLKAHEARLLEEFAEEQRQAGMSAEQRQFLSDKKKFEDERGQYQAEQSRAKEQAEQEAHVARISEIGKRLESVAVGALQRAKIDGGQVPHFIQAIADRLDRNERLGLGLDEAEVADVVMQEHESLATGWLKGKSAPDLADVLESTGGAKALMEEFARRIRAKRGDVPGVRSETSMARGQAQAVNGSSQTMAEKMAAARIFGGGGR